MKYEELKNHLIQEATKQKFRNDTNDPKKLRNYFKNMIEKLVKPLLEIDDSFYEHGPVQSHSDNYFILDGWKIIVSESENVVYFRKSKDKPDNYLLIVNFEDDKARVNEKELQKSDLEQLIIELLLDNK